jgi:hypothetical protein
MTGCDTVQGQDEEEEGGYRSVEIREDTGQ